MAPMWLEVFPVVARGVVFWVSQRETSQCSTELRKLTPYLGCFDLSLRFLVKMDGGSGQSTQTRARTTTVCESYKQEQEVNWRFSILTREKHTERQTDTLRETR